MSSNTLDKIKDIFDNLEILDYSQNSSNDISRFIENVDSTPTRYEKINIKQLDKNTVEILIEPHKSLDKIEI